MQFFFKPISPEFQNTLSLKQTHPDHHWLSNAQRKLTATSVSDASDYMIGGFYTWKGEIFALKSKAMKLNYHGGSRSAKFKKSSTTRELFAILHNLQSNLEVFRKLPNQVYKSPPPQNFKRMNSRFYILSSIWLVKTFLVPEAFLQAKFNLKYRNDYSSV